MRPGPALVKLEPAPAAERATNTIHQQKMKVLSFSQHYQGITDKEYDLSSLNLLYCPTWQLSDLTGS